MSEKIIYLNPKQFELLSKLRKKNAFIAGRGSGKSTVGAEYLFRCVDTMPRASGALVAPTMEIIYNRSLPAIQEHWSRMGLEEGIDYVIGKRPPSDFFEPYAKPLKYDKVISWANGSAIYLISLYEGRGQGAGRGLNIQFLLGDEMGFAKRESLTKGVFPAMRGNFYKIARIELDGPEIPPFGKVLQQGASFIWEIPFAENPFYLSHLLLSSMPYLNDGKWLLDYEEDPEALYVEATAQDNIAVLGPDYIKNLRGILPELEFRVEVLNERFESLPDGFYPAFDEEKHIFLDDHYSPDQPLDLSFDFGAHINLMIIAQAERGAVYVNDCLYIKQNTVNRLIENFVEKYKGHKNKLINIYGDRNGNSRQINSTKSLYQEIIEGLHGAGWRALNHVRGLDPPHAQKHLFINALLSEERPALPKLRIHKIRGKNLILSIKQAPIKEGFKKDKSSERPDNPIPQEQATHFSDALDNYLFTKFRHFYGAQEAAEAGAAGAGLQGLIG